MDEKELPKKEKYEKPEILRIELAAEEVMAVGCKRAPGHKGRGGNPYCGVASFCRTSGS